jgi:hypothetical protein
MSQRHTLLTRSTTEITKKNATAIRNEIQSSLSSAPGGAL